MFAVHDRVVETTTTTGTGAVTLAGAIIGYRTFTAACTDGDVVRYLIEAVDANGSPTGDWETGTGVFSAATPSVSRDHVIASSNAGALVSLAAGTKRVHLSANAGQLAFRGCQVHQITSDFSGNFTTATAITWNAESYDTDAIHDNVTNPSRLSAPADVSMVRASALITLSGVASGELVTLTIKDTGSASYNGMGIVTKSSATTTPSYFVTTGVQDYGYGGGGYFEVFVQVASSTSSAVTRAKSWFQLEIIR